MSQDENLGDTPEPPLIEKNLNVTKSPLRVKKGKRLDNQNCRSVLLCPLRRQSLVLFRTNIVYSMIVLVSKHIDVRYHWICDALDAKLLELTKVHTDDNGANMIIKAFLRGNFEACCEIGNTNRMTSLNGTKYPLWKGKMKDLLFVKKMHLPIFAVQKPESMSNEEWDFEHQQVCGFIQLFVDDNVYNHIASEIHVMTLWEKIESLYASNLKFKESTSLSDHLNEFQRIFYQMSRMGIKFEDEILGLLLLNSLPKS
ncbi:hypothetical protein CR513_25386, partial [Mucuna pruriens]